VARRPLRQPRLLGRRPAALVGAAVGWLALSLLLDGHTSSLWIVEARKLAFAVLIGGLIVGLDGARHVALTAGSKIGRAGYSIYALHAPIIVALLIAGVPWLLCALAAIAVALVTFTVYERPLTRVGARRAAQLAQ
jgi:peptidoglycan/LPS O-acetylase OafA/YrhL